jgi:hypothetical protein
MTTNPSGPCALPQTGETSMDETTLEWEYELEDYLASLTDPEPDTDFV